METQTKKLYIKKELHTKLETQAKKEGFANTGDYVANLIKQNTSKPKKQKDSKVVRLDVDFTNFQKAKDNELSLEDHLEEVLIQYCGLGNYDMKVVSVPGDLKDVEFETVALKIPKRIMDYLRGMEKASGNTAIEELEYDLVDSFRAQMESISGVELIKNLELGPIFRTVLEDKRFS